MAPRKFRNGPFEHVAWSPEKKKAVDVVEEWHDFLMNQCNFSSIQEAKENLRKLKKQLENKEPQEIIPTALGDKVVEVAAELDLPLEWFYSQLDVAHYFYGAIQMEDAREFKSFVAGWESPHVYLIAKLADAAYTWQRKLIDELTMALFIVDHLLNLPADLSSGRVFIPLSEMQHAGVSLDELKRGERTEALERLLWKQTIRARDAFAQGQPLIKELERKYRGVVKKNWLTGLEYINEIEKRKYDLWSNPLDLSGLQRFQVVVLSWIGRGVRKGSS